MWWSREVVEVCVCVCVVVKGGGGSVCVCVWWWSREVVVEVCVRVWWSREVGEVCVCAGGWVYTAFSLSLTLSLSFSLPLPILSWVLPDFSIVPRPSTQDSSSPALGSSAPAPLVTAFCPGFFLISL